MIFLEPIREKQYLQVVSDFRILQSNLQLKVLLVFLSAIVTIGLAGCASPKFSKTERANVGVFAEMTITLLNEGDFEFSRDETIHTREFYLMDEPEERQLEAISLETEKAFKNLIEYSLELVTFLETKDTEKEKVRAYGNYLSGIQENLVKKLDMDENRYESKVLAVKSQKKYLDALRMAQPIITTYGRYINVLLDRVEDSLDAVTTKIDVRIDHRFAEVIKYQAELEKEKYAVLRAMSYLYHHRVGDPEGMEKLRRSNAILLKDLVPKGEPTQKELAAISEHLKKRLETLHLVGVEISPDWENYRAAHDELNVLHDKAKQQIQLARRITLVWLWGHLQMASGIEDPAEWFEFSQISGSMLKMGSKLVF